MRDMAETKKGLAPAKPDEHVPAEDGMGELSVSVVTETQLKNVGR